MYYRDRHNTSDSLEINRMGQDLQDVKVPGDILIASQVPDILQVISMGHSTSGLNICIG